MRFAIWFLALLASGATFAFADDPKAGHYSVFDGRQDAAPAPVIILLHGMMGTGDGMRRRTGFDQFAAKRGLIAVYPTAPERRWNDGRWRVLGRPDLAARDDVGWLAAIIKDLAQRGIGDPEQVYLLGHSNGGGMAMTFACDRPGLIAGVGIVSTKALVAAPCTSPAPIPAIFFYGTADIIAPHRGRTIRDEHMPGDPLGATKSADDTLAAWASRNGCKTPGTAIHSDPDTTDATTLAITDWTGCKAPLRYIAMIGGGHVFPGTPEIRHARTRRLLGPAIRDIHAGGAALSFWFDR